MEPVPFATSGILGQLEILMRCFSLSHETTLRNFTSRPFSRFCLASVGSLRNRDFAFGVEEETTGNKRKRGGPPLPSNPRRRSPPPRSPSRSPSPHRSKDYGSGDSDAEGHLSEGGERPPPPPPKNGKNHIVRDLILALDGFISASINGKIHGTSVAVGR
jgi:hypothetical protein